MPFGHGEVDVQDTIVGQCGNRRAGFHVLPQVDSPQAKLAGKWRAYQAQGYLFLRLFNQCPGFVMGCNVLLVFGAGQGLAVQAPGAFKVRSGEAQCNTATLQVAAQRAVVQLHQRCAGGDGLATGEVNMGDAPGYLGGDQHLLIGNHCADGIECGGQHLAANCSYLHGDRTCFADRQCGLGGGLLAVAVVKVKPANRAEQGEGRQGQWLGERVIHDWPRAAGLCHERG
ncbi:hypothetical protein D9M71_592230 [compost metagenome]